MSDWAESVAQVLTGQGAPVGAGFLAAGDVLFTCAHVVLEAGSDVGGLVRLRFPRADGAPEAVGRVLRQGWQPPDGQDIALVNLEQEAPTGMQPLPLAGSAGRRGHQVRMFGFPAQAGPGGHFGCGRAGDLLQPSLLQLFDASDVTTGFSGGPVWDEQAAAVIGMVTKVIRADRLGKGAGIAYATSTATLRAACPALQVAEVCPYRGIEPFGAEHADLFYGRDRAVRNVLDALAGRPPLLLLLGPSGAGKSSLLQAGVLPQLAAGALPGSKQWSIAVVRPGPMPPTGHDLLVIDQFEEMFTEPQTVTTLTEQVTAIGRPGRTVLLVMRDDFYARLAAEAPGLLDPPGRGGPRPEVVNIPATLDRDELHDIIAAPAEAAQARLQDGLAERIIDDVLAGKPRAPATVLPLLQVALKQLWEGQDDGVMNRQAYDDFDGLSGSITTWCDQRIEGLPETVTRTVLTMLVQPASTDPQDQTPAVRRQRLLSKLHEAAGDDRAVVDRLVNDRVIVTRGSDAAGTAVAELAHDSLIDRWRTLRKWVDEDADYQRWLLRADQKRQQWTRQCPHDPADLLSGYDLAEGLRWKVRHWFPSDTAAFLDASHAQQLAGARRDRRRRRAYQMVAAALTLLTVVATTTAVLAARYATRANNQHRLALSRLLASKSRDAVDRVDAEQLAAAALATSATPDALDAASLLLADHRRALPAESGVAAFGPDGTLATGSADGTVRIWNPWTGRLVGNTIAGATGPVRTLRFSPDGTLLVTGDALSQRWDTRTRHLVDWPLGVVNGEADVFNPDGTRMATVSNDGTVHVWDTYSGQQVGTLRPGDGVVQGMVFSPNGRLLAVRTHDGTVQLWNWQTGRPAGPPVSGGLGTSPAMVLSPDGKLLALGCDNATIQLWNLPTMRPAGRIPTDEMTVERAEFSPVGDLLAVEGHDGTVRLWHTRTAKPAGRLATGSVREIVFSPDGSRLATVGGTVEVTQLWDPRTGRAIGGPLPSRGHAPGRPLFSPDSKLLATPDGLDATVRLWNAVTALPADELPGSVPAEGQTAFSGDSKQLVTIAVGNSFPRWDLWNVAGAPTPGSSFTGATRILLGSHDALVATTGADGTLRLRNERTGQAVGQRLPADVAQADEMALSPDGTLLATAGSDGTARMWDLHSGRAVSGAVRGDSGQAPVVAFSPDSTLLATAGSDGTVRLWDRTGRLVGGPLKGNSYSVTDLRFSPDGKQLAAVVGGGTHAIVWLWDPQTGRLIRPPIDAPTGLASAIAFSQDGVLMAAVGGINQPVRVWDLQAGHALGGPLAVTAVPSGAFSPDGETLALNDDDVVRLWDLWPFRNPLAQLCDRVGGISTKTWRSYIPDEPAPHPCR